MIEWNKIASTSPATGSIDREKISKTTDKPTTQIPQSDQPQQYSVPQKPLDFSVKPTDAKLQTTQTSPQITSPTIQSQTPAKTDYGTVDTLKSLVSSMTSSERGLGETLASGYQLDQYQKSLSDHQSSVDFYKKNIDAETDPEKKKQKLEALKNFDAPKIEDFLGANATKTTTQKIGEIAGVSLDMISAGYGTSLVEKGVQETIPMILKGMVSKKAIPSLILATGYGISNSLQGDPTTPKEMTQRIAVNIAENIPAFLGGQAALEGVGAVFKMMNRSMTSEEKTLATILSKAPKEVTEKEKVFAIDKLKQLAAASESLRLPEPKPVETPKTVSEIVTPKVETPLSNEAIPQGRFHGTSSKLEKLMSDEEMYSQNSIYGQGFYTTDNHAIAQGYAKKGGGSERNIYNVAEKNKVPVYNIEKPMGKLVDRINELMKYSNFGEDYKATDTMRSVYDDIRELSASGEFSIHDAQDLMAGLKEIISAEGYRGIEHTGGQLTGNAPHNVKIYWNPAEDLTINKLSSPKVETPSPLSNEAKPKTVAEIVKPVDTPKNETVRLSGHDYVVKERFTNGKGTESVTLADSKTGREMTMPSSDLKEAIKTSADIEKNLTPAEYKLTYPETKTTESVQGLLDNKNIKATEATVKSLSEGKTITGKQAESMNIKFRKSDITEIMKLAKDFKEDPTLTMKDGKLTFEGKTNSFTIDPKAIGITSEIPEGAKIDVSEIGKEKGSLPVLEGKGKSEGETLYSEAFPGAKAAAEGINAAATKMKELGDDIGKAFNPSQQGEGFTASQILRQGRTTVDNYVSMMKKAGQELLRYFNKLKPEEQRALIAQYEKTGSFGNKVYDKIYHDNMDYVHEILSKVSDKVGERENYIRHSVKFTSPDKDFSGKVIRTLKTGSTSVFKKAEYPTLEALRKALLDQGLKENKDFIINYNPEELRQWTLENARRIESFNWEFNSLKDNGMVKFIKRGADASGYVKLDDSVFKVMFKGGEGMVDAGSYYAADPKIAKILNNAISEGFDSAWMKSAEDLNRLALSFRYSLSGAHSLMTMVSSMTSQMAEGFKNINPIRTTPKGKLYLSVKQLPKGIGQIASSLWAGATDVARGRSNWLKAVGGNQSYMQGVDWANRAGFRIDSSRDFRVDSQKALQEALKTHNVAGILGHGAESTIKYLSRAIVEFQVPMTKYGRFLQESAGMVDRVTDGGKISVPKEVIDRNLRRIADSIDYIHGQLNLDNLFWNRKTKQLSQFAVGALGWHVGDVKVVQEGASDLLTTLSRAKKGEEILSPAMAKTMTYVFGVSAIGEIYNYMHTGTWCNNFMDSLMPKDGTKNADGTDHRVMLMSYMKDYFSVQEKKLAAAEDWDSPVLSAITDFISNKSWDGTQIRDTDSSLLQQGLDFAKYEASQNMPIGVNQTLQAPTTGSLSSRAENVTEKFLGVSNQPAYLKETPAQKAIYNMLGDAPKTKEEAQSSKDKSAVRTLIQQGKTSEAQSGIKDLLSKGELSPDGVKQFVKEAKLTSDVRAFQTLSADSQEKILKNYPDQRSNYLPYAKKVVQLKF